MMVIFNAKLTELKMKCLQDKYRFTDDEKTPEKMLEYAMTAEQTCIDIGPFDPSFTRFKKQQQDFEAAAFHLEQLAFHSKKESVL